MGRITLSPRQHFPCFLYSALEIWREAFSIALPKRCICRLSAASLNASGSDAENVAKFLRPKHFLLLFAHKKEDVADCAFEADYN